MTRIALRLTSRLFQGVLFCLFVFYVFIGSVLLHILFLSIETPEEHSNGHDENCIEIDKPPLPRSLKQEVSSHLSLLRWTQLAHLREWHKLKFRGGRMCYFWSVKTLFQKQPKENLSTCGISTATPFPSSISTPQSQLRPILQPARSFLLAVKWKPDFSSGKNYTWSNWLLTFCRSCCLPFNILSLQGCADFPRSPVEEGFRHLPQLNTDLTKILKRTTLRRRICWFLFLSIYIVCLLGVDFRQQQKMLAF